MIQLSYLHTVTQKSWHPNGTQFLVGCQKNGLGAKLHADLVTISHQEIAPSLQLGVEQGLVRSGRRLYGTATTCPSFPRGKAQSIVKLVRVLAIILLKCYPHIVSVMDVVLRGLLSLDLQHGVWCVLTRKPKCSLY